VCPAKGIGLKRKFNEVRLPLETADVNSTDYDYEYKDADSASDRQRKAPSVIRAVEAELRVREKAGALKHFLTFHELHVTTDALDILIPKLQAAGYKFVTASEYRRAI